LDLQGFVETKFLIWVLVLTRTAGMFTIAPFFSGWFIPISSKILLSVFLSWLVLPNIDEAIPLSLPITNLLLSMVGNYLIGLSIGLVALLPVVALSIAGEIFGTQMGFALSSVYDPQREEVPIIGEMLYVIGLFILVSLKGHMLIYQAVVDSLRLIPLKGTLEKFDFVNVLINQSEEMFTIAMKIGLPLIGFMLVVSISLGIISRLIPQMNVFMIGMPLKVLVGIILFVGLIPVWVDVISQIVSRLSNILWHFVGVLSQ